MFRFPRIFPVRTIVTAMLALLLGAASQAAEVPSERPPCCRPALTNSPPTDRSIYQLESVWTSDVGARVRLDVFQGRPQVIALFFTQCEYACPVLVNDLKKLQAALPESLRASVDFILVSFDTERDTPAALAEYRKLRHLGTDHWTLLTGGADDVRELAALLGVNYRKDARGQFAHSNLLTHLNEKGEIIFQQAGLDQDPCSSVAALVRAMKQ